MPTCWRIKTNFFASIRDNHHVRIFANGSIYMLIILVYILHDWRTIGSIDLFIIYGYSTWFEELIMGFADEQPDGCDYA